MVEGATAEELALAAVSAIAQLQVSTADVVQQNA
jgi:hypothetical protein